MSEDCNLLYHFLKLNRGSWRNATYIECRGCPYGKDDCSEHLLTIDSIGKPFVLSVAYFEKSTDDKIDKFECTCHYQQRSI